MFFSVPLIKPTLRNVFCAKERSDQSNFPSGEIGRGNYHDSKPLYLGMSPQAWLVSAGSASLLPRLNCTHEEADDRMMFHVQDIVSPRSGPT